MQAPMQGTGEDHRPGQPHTLQKEQQPDRNRYQVAKQPGKAPLARQQHGKRHRGDHGQRKAVGTAASGRVHGGAYPFWYCARCGRSALM
jgi:hypothetical protein